MIIFLIHLKCWIILGFPVTMIPGFGRRSKPGFGLVERFKPSESTRIFSTDDPLVDHKETHWFTWVLMKYDEICNPNVQWEVDQFGEAAMEDSAQVVASQTRIYGKCRNMCGVGTRSWIFDFMVSQVMGLYPWLSRFSSILDRDFPWQIHQPAFFFWAISIFRWKPPWFFCDFWVSRRINTSTFTKNMGKWWFIWKDPPFCSWVVINYFDWAMASIANCKRLPKGRCLINKYKYSA